MQGHPPKVTPGGSRWLRRWAVRAVAVLGLTGLALADALPPRGPNLMEVVLPRPGAVVGVEGVELIVRLPADLPGGGAVWETLRVLLNGADVTDELTTGENGAYGVLPALLDGENVLRFEVFGRTPWRSARLFEQVREVRIRHRPRLDWNRA